MSCIQLIKEEEEQSIALSGLLLLHFDVIVILSDLMFNFVDIL